MRKIVIFLLLAAALTVPAAALDYTAPEAPDGALELLPEDSTGFSEDLWYVVRSALESLQPRVAQAAGVCVSVFALGMLVSVVKTMGGRAASAAELTAVLAGAALLLRQTSVLIALAVDTVSELSEYGRLLLPVMAAALASQGGVTASTALYAGTAVFDSILSGGITRLLVPMVYAFLVLAVAAAAAGERMLGKLRDFVKWLATWCLKMVLYVFTGYMSITGVVSGSTDAATLKATKLTLSGMIPVVGGILSDASEAVVVGAGVMKNAVGIYGLLAFIAIWIAPFLRIGAQYLLLKLTSALCEIFDVKPLQELLGAFTAAMGLLLGMTGSVCILLLISTVCFMKGVA